MEQDSTTTEADGTALSAAEAWFDPIDVDIRGQVRGLIEKLLHANRRRVRPNSHRSRMIHGHLNLPPNFPPR